MGAWGPGLQANDAALDAIGMFEKRIRSFPLRKGPAVEFLTSVIKACGEDETEGTLGVADLLLDRGVDLGDGGDLVRLMLERTLTESELRNWDDPAERVAALRRCEQRLNGAPVDPLLLAADNAPVGSPARTAPKKGSWKAEAASLRKDLARQLKAYRRQAVEFVGRIRRSAKRLAQQKPAEQLKILSHASDLWESGMLDDEGFADLVDIMAAGQWRFPSRPLLNLLNRWCLGFTCPLLVPLLRDRSAQVRIDALDFIYRFEARRFSADLARLLGDPAPEVRIAAIRALRAHRLETAGIRERLSDPNPKVRQAAEQALGR